MTEQPSEMNILGKISFFFASRKPLSTLLMLALLVFGLISFWLTPKQYNPEITRPAFAISIVYSGATTDEAIDRVVYELVEKVRTLPGVDDVYTYVQDGAFITTTVIFDVGFDKTVAKVDLLSQLDQHSYMAKGFISKPQVMEINPETIPVLQIAFSSNTATLSKIREDVTNIANSLGEIDNISGVDVVGGYTDSLIVEIDPNKLASLNISINQISKTLYESQMRLVTKGLSNKNFNTEIVFDGRSTTPEEIKNLKIINDVAIKDIATVYRGSPNNRSYVWYRDSDKNGEVVMMAVSKVEGSSAPTVTKAVHKKIEKEIKKYDGLTYKIVSDDGIVATKAINGLTKNLITSILIVAMVLLLFLSLQASSVVLVAIPTTLLIVFGLGLIFGQTINRITLFALILSLGLLVDSAIVVVENIYSHLKEAKDAKGMERVTVIATAVNEIGIGLVLSTLTSVIVFLPMNYITGMMGPYMGPIAFFVPIALLVSLFIAITITPFMATHMLHVDRRPNKITIVVGKIMNKITKHYQTSLKKIFDSKKRQRKLLFSIFLVFVASVALPAFGLVHFKMLPNADRNQFYVYIDLPYGTVSKDLTKKVTDDISEILIKNKNVSSAQEFISTPPILDFNGMFKGAQNRASDNQSTIRVNLTPEEERSITSSKIVAEMRKAISERHPAYSKYIQFIEEPPGPPVRATLVAKISANNKNDQEKINNFIYELFKKTNGVVDIHNSTDEPTGRVRYTLDQVSARKYAVSPVSIYSILSLATTPTEVAEYQGAEKNEYTPIIIELPKENIKSTESVLQLKVKNSNGESIPLSSVLKEDHELRPPTRYLEDSTELTYITGEVEGRSIVYVVIEIMKNIIKNGVEDYQTTNWNLFGVTLKNTSGNILNIHWGGEWKMTLENFRDLGVATAVALLLVYGILVAQYNKFATPAYILITVPLGLIGILWGFLLLDNGFGIYLTATALIGFIALIGLVVNNAIIYLEYVEQAIERGASFKDALIEAGGARIRPILLTSLTTILGSLTIASDPVWSGLAWSIVFGLSLSTVLTLVVYPTLLVYFTDKNNT